MLDLFCSHDREMSTVFLRSIIDIRKKIVDKRRKFVWKAEDSPVQEVFDDEFNHIGGNPMMSENEYNVPEESAEDSQNADKSGLEFDEET